MNLDPTQNPVEALQIFRFSIKTPWGLVISDSYGTVLWSTFGKEPAATIQPPGVAMMARGPMLYCGLDEPVSALEPTVGQIFEYAGLGNVVERLPSIIPSLTATLNASNYAGKRNALWFNPALNFQTTLQLHFQLDAKYVLQDLLTDELRGFEITEAVVVCKKVLIESMTIKGLEGIDKGSVSFAVGCAITAKRARVDMTAGINFGRSGITITVNPSPGTLGHILAWLEDVATLDPASVYSQSRHMKLEKQASCCQPCRNRQSLLDQDGSLPAPDNFGPRWC